MIAFGNGSMPMLALKPISDQNRENANGKRHGANQIGFHHSPFASRKAPLPAIWCSAVCVQASLRASNGLIFGNGPRRRVTEARKRFLPRRHCYVCVASVHWQNRYPG
jgi:hypothetical protein